MNCPASTPSSTGSSCWIRGTKRSRRRAIRITCATTQRFPGCSIFSGGKPCEQTNMSAKANNFNLGLFVLIGIGVLIAGLFAFGARAYFQQRITFETYATGQVDGLSVGSAMLLRGV